MTDRAGQTPSQPGAIAAGIEMEQVIEAVCRGVARTWASQDDVSGYALSGYDLDSLSTPSFGLIVFCRPPGTATGTRDLGAPRGDRLAQAG